MEAKDKTVLIGTIVTASFLLYMIKPEPVSAFCSDWDSSLFHRSMDFEDKRMFLDDIIIRELNLNDEFIQEYMNEYHSLERDSLANTIVCSNIATFF